MAKLSTGYGTIGGNNKRRDGKKMAQQVIVGKARMD
jgi:hypothetical protein